MGIEPSGFLARWAQRKQQVRSGTAPAPEPIVAQPVVSPPVAATPPLTPVAVPTPAGAEAPVVQPPAEPAPTMADVALLTRESDYSRFVGAGVDEGVQRAAMKKLFTDPHFNVMDGLDTYIDDYGKPDPIPLSMLRQMNQSKFLRLFDDDEEDEAKKRSAESASAQTASGETASAETASAPTAPEPTTAPDDDPDLQLQPDDAPGRPEPEPGARA